MMSGLRPHGAIVLSGIGGKGPKAAPLGGQQLLRSKLPDAEAALEAEAARQHVVRLIAEREATIDALRHLLPSPRGVVQRRRATRALLLTPDASAQLRQRLAQLISQLRWCGSRICDAVGVWKGTLRSRYAYFRSMPEREMTFFHEVSEQRPPKGGSSAQGHARARGARPEGQATAPPSRPRPRGRAANGRAPPRPEGERRGRAARESGEGERGEGERGA